MNSTIQLQIDKHQFQLLQNLFNAEVIMIGDDFIHEDTSVIFNEFDDYKNKATGNVIIRLGAFKTLQYTQIVGTMCLFLIAYNNEGVRVPLGLSGVRKSDKLEYF